MFKTTGSDCSGYGRRRLNRKAQIFVTQRVSGAIALDPCAIPDASGGRLCAIRWLAQRRRATMRQPPIELHSRRPAASPSPMPIRYARLRALVVEDHPFQRVAAEGLLRHLGVQTPVCAENGTQAAEILAREPFDIVLCDIEMPGGNGPELIAELHRRGAACLCRGGADVGLGDGAGGGHPGFKPRPGARRRHPARARAAQAAVARCGGRDPGRCAGAPARGRVRPAGVVTRRRGTARRHPVRHGPAGHAAAAGGPAPRRWCAGAIPSTAWYSPTSLSHGSKHWMRPTRCSSLCAWQRSSGCAQPASTLRWASMRRRKPCAGRACWRRLMPWWPPAACRGRR